MGVWWLSSKPTYEGISVWTSMWVPSSGTNDGDSFALLLDVFDSDNYYDQIGLASDYGCSNGCGNPYNTWSVAYEQGTYGTDKWGTTCCGCNGTYSRDALNDGQLQPNSWYTFDMDLTTEYLVFSVYEGKDTMSDQLWSLALPDTASYFLIQSEDTLCHGGTPADGGAQSMMLDEEVDYVHGSLSYPQWNFRFFNTTFFNSATLSPFQIPNSDWYGNYTTGFSKPATNFQPYNTSFDQGLYQVEITNEGFRLSFSTPSCTVSPGGDCYEYGYLEPAGQFAPTDYCVVKTCTVSTVACGAPSGWSVSCSITSPVPDYIEYGSAEWFLAVPSGASSGIYYGGVGVTVTSNSDSEYDNWVFQIIVT